MVHVKHIWQPLILWLVPVVALALYLFAPAQSLRGYGTVGAWIQEIEFTFRDAETQWMVLACLGVYFVAFTILRRRQADRLSKRATVLNPDLLLNLNPDSGARVAPRPTVGMDNPDLWLFAVLWIAAGAYAFNYSAASKSTEALMLLAGMVLGKGAAVWARWGTGESEVRSPKSEINPAVTIQGGGRKVGAVVFILIALLLAACCWQAEEMRTFHYRGQARWSGPWANPNIFGMLMGVGVVLAVGQVLLRRGNIEHPTSNIQHRTWKQAVGQWLQVIFLWAAAAVIGFGLLKSYSRGAWVAALCGLAYLAWQFFNHEIHQRNEREKETGRSGLSGNSCLSWLRKNWIPLAVIFISLSVIAFWNFRDTERTVARRAFSVGNVNDFSWRNRVAAWEGALQIMAEKPWLGVGWNQPQRVFNRYYLPFRMEESAAIQMNDHLMLGMTLGIPALVCFIAYVGMSLSPKSRVRNPESKDMSPRLVCRAGAIVLLVAFWFDGGLFKLATGATFWILLELGREE